MTDLDTNHVRVEVRDAVATVTITRADALNALHPPAHHALSLAFDALAETPDVRVIILTGEGTRAFCAGYDLKHNLETGVIDLPPTGFGGLTRRMNYPVPIIAAVNGVALGGGFEMALACDFIVAGRSARFGLPEPKVGWAALNGGVQRLPHAVGIKRALDIILTGRIFGAEEALGMGLVSEVVDDDVLAEAARRWALQVAATAPLALGVSLRAAYETLHAPFPTPEDIMDRPDVRRMLDSEDAREGKKAFAERRPPVWRGR